MDNFETTEQAVLERLKAEGEPVPEECGDNERAVQYLAAQTGVGHYDNINLLVMATLLIFTAVLFLAVNSGDNNTADNLPLTKESFLSGEYTKSLEKRYEAELPVPELMLSIKNHVKLVYGIGNTLPADRRQAVRDEEPPEENENAFSGGNREERDDISAHKITTTVAVTDENGETVTTQATEEDDRSGGTTAVNRPYETEDVTSTSQTSSTSSTTTNNDPPEVTTTTTVMYTDPVTEQPTETSPTETTPTETAPTETTPTETTPDQTTETTTEPPAEPEEP